MARDVFWYFLEKSGDRRDNTMNNTMNTYEKAWILFSIAVVIVFLIILGYYGFAVGIHTPHKAEVIDPKKISEDSRFAKPRVEEIIPGKEYRVYVVARMWMFQPSEIVVPKNAKVTFYITSADVVHGFQIVGTNIQTMVLPGYVSIISTRFDKPGEYLIICNEYCGEGHHLMKAKLIVKEV